MARDVPLLIASRTIVRTQLLSELEEVITYKKSADQPDRQQIIKKTWTRRSAPSFIARPAC